MEVIDKSINNKHRTDLDVSFLEPKWVYKQLASKIAHNLQILILQHRSVLKNKIEDASIDYLLIITIIFG